MVSVKGALCLAAPDIGRHAFWFRQIRRDPEEGTFGLGYTQCTCTARLENNAIPIFFRSNVTIQ